MYSTKNEFKDILNQIKNDFGLEVFKDKRASAYFRDIAPNNKRDINMLNILNNRKIMANMIDLKDASENEKQNFLTTTLLLLVEQSFIQDTVAQQYLRDLTEIFNWGNYASLLENLVSRNRSNSREEIEKELENNRRMLNQMKKDNSQFIKDFNNLKRAYDLKVENFNNLKNDIENDHYKLINIKNELYEKLDVLQQQSNTIVIDSKDLDQQYSKKRSKGDVSEATISDLDKYYSLLVKHEKSFDKLKTLYDDLNKIAIDLPEKTYQLVQLRNELIPLKDRYESVKIQYDESTADSRVIEEKINQLKNRLSALPV